MTDTNQTVPRAESGFAAPAQTDRERPLPPTNQCPSRRLDPAPFFSCLVPAEIILASGRRSPGFYVNTWASDVPGWRGYQAQLGLDETSPAASVRHGRCYRILGNSFTCVYSCIYYVLFLWLQSDARLALDKCLPGTRLVYLNSISYRVFIYVSHQN